MTRSPSTISAPASAARRASRETQRAGESAPSRRMDDRRLVQPVERRGQLGDPLDREAVVAERVVLAAQSLGLVGVDGEPHDADPPERVAREDAPCVRATAR